jgi:hypothetical protein
MLVHMITSGTASARPARRRVVRRRGALDAAWDTVLAELPSELRLLVRRYAENMRQGQEIRSELCTVMPAYGLRWHDVSMLTNALAFDGR